MAYRYARTTAVVGTAGGGTARVVKGEVWSSHDPIVTANPDLFADEPTVVRGEGEPVVEQATAAPGEKRTAAKRPAKRA